MSWEQHDRSCLQLSEADAPVADPCAGDVIMFAGGTLIARSRSDRVEILGKARRAQCTRVSARPHPHSLRHSIAMAAMTVMSSMAKPVPARLGRASSALPFSRSPVSRNAVRRVASRLQAVQGPIDVQVGHRNDATGAGQLRAQRASDKAFLASRCFQTCGAAAGHAMIEQHSVTCCISGVWHVDRQADTSASPSCTFVAR